MIAFLATIALLQGNYAQCELANPTGGPTRLMYQVPDDPVEPPKLSPRKFGDGRYEFDWLVRGYARPHTTDDLLLRFRVYSQERKAEDYLAPQVAQTLLRLYDYNFQNLGLDHRPDYNRGIVDVYLCYGGQAGGEQLFDQEIVDNRPVKVNTIYIYDLPSFNPPIERLREVCHEYGHATLPAVGGFQSPEDWANGYLGERLYIRWLRNGLAKGWFTTNDTLQATPGQLDGWLAKNVNPMVTKVAENGPNASLLAQKGPDAMNAYMATALYMASLFPDKVFSRSMKLTGSVKAIDYLEGIRLAVQEQPSRLTIPTYLTGRKIWVPIADGTLSGATILKRKSDWVQIQAGSGTVTVVPRR